MTDLKKILLTFCCLSIYIGAYAQNQADNRLVDSRVTLDDNTSKDPTDNTRKNDRTLPSHTPARPKAMSPTDTMPQLPSSFDGVTVKTWLDNDSITIGDQTTLHLLIEGCTSKDIRLQKSEEIKIDGIEALEVATDTIRGNDGNVSALEQRITVTSFDAGTHPVRGLAIGIVTNGKTTLIAPDDSTSLTVAYVAEADTTKCEAKQDAAPLKEPYTFWEITRWIVLALLVAAIAMAIAWIIKRRKEHKPIVVLPKAKPVPADKRALAELEALRRKELWQKGRIKKYYTDITDIVRRFLRNMYGISASEMTTRQTLRAFHGASDWSEENESLLRQLLQKADLVKFAKSQPESHEHDAAMQIAVDFIHKVAETHRINNPEAEERK